MITPFSSTTFVVVGGGTLGGGGGEANVVHGHPGGLGTAELGENDADGHILHVRALEAWGTVESRSEDGGQKFLGMCVAQAALFRSTDGRSEGRENDDVGRRLGQDGGDGFRHDEEFEQESQ